MTLNNTAATPAPALKLTAKYPGTYGNQLGLRSRINAAQPTYNDLLVVLAGNVVESYTYLATDITGLAAQINAGSKWLISSDAGHRHRAEHEHAEHGDPAGDRQRRLDAAGG